MKDIVKYPHIDSPTPEGQIKQITEWLFYLADLLNYEDLQSDQKEVEDGLQAQANL